MNEQKMIVALEVLIRWFEESVACWETQTGKEFPNVDRELYNSIIIEEFRKAPDDQTKYNLIFRASTIATGINIGFLPSEYCASSDRALSFFDSIDVPAGTQDYEKNDLYKERAKNYGEINFWVGIDRAGDFKWEESKNWLDRAFEDRLLPRKMILASLLLRAWCNVHLQEYDDAVADLVTLTDEVKLRTAGGKQRVEYIKGYIKALAEYNLRIKRDKKLCCILPDDEADEIALDSNKQIPLTREEFFKRMDTFEKTIREMLSDLSGENPTDH